MNIQNTWSSETSVVDCCCARPHFVKYPHTHTKKKACIKVNIGSQLYKIHLSFSKFNPTDKTLATNPNVYQNAMEKMRKKHFHKENYSEFQMFSVKLFGENIRII